MINLKWLMIARLSVTIKEAFHIPYNFWSGGETRLPLRKLSSVQRKKIKALCEQTRELTDDLHDFLDYV